MYSLSIKKFKIKQKISVYITKVLTQARLMKNKCQQL